MSYDRYAAFRNNGSFNITPTVAIDTEPSDLYIIYDSTRMRFDLLSYKYFGDANYAWLILLANPQYGSLEFMIPHGVKLRIPYPLNSALQRYEKKIVEWITQHPTRL